MADHAMIFRNLLNGVPDWQVARDLNVTLSEVKSSFAFVLKKIKSYHFERCRLPIIGETVEEIRKSYRIICLSALEKINLAKEPKFAKIITEKVTGDNALDIAKELNT